MTMTMTIAMMTVIMIMTWTMVIAILTKVTDDKRYSSPIAALRDAMRRSTNVECGLLLVL